MALTTANAKSHEKRYCRMCQRQMPRRAAKRQPKAVCSTCEKHKEAQ